MTTDTLSPASSTLDARVAEATRDTHTRAADAARAASARVSEATRAEVQDLVYRSAWYLDEQRFGEWFELTSSDFRYRIQAYSPVLRKEMTWLDHDRASLEALVELLPKHHTNGADWLRQVIVGSLAQETLTEISAVSTLTVFQTIVDVGDAHVDGGSSQLFLAGRYHDTFRRESSVWRLAERTVRLQTRQLGVGSHFFV